MEKMKNDLWWLVPGVVIKLNNDMYKLSYDHKWVLVINFNDCNIRFEDLKNPKLRDVPFNYILDWADKIIFNEKGEFQFCDDEGYLLNGITANTAFIPFNNCPEAWKNKTFKITDKLRKLIK